MGKRNHKAIELDTARIITYINNKEGVTIKQIMDDLCLSEWKVGEALRGIRRNTPDEITVATEKSEETHGFRYVYYPADQAEKEEEPVKEDNPFKNSEQYNDPTAGRAIANVGNRSRGLVPGAIYKDQHGQLFLVIREFPDTVIGYRVNVVDNGNVTTDSSVVWAAGATSRLVNTNRVCSMNARNLDLSSFSRCPFDAFRAVLRRSPFNECKTIEIPVEVVKEVEIVKEVPVEVIKEVVKEVPADNTAEPNIDVTELALLKQKLQMTEEFNDILLGIIYSHNNVDFSSLTGK